MSEESEIQTFPLPTIRRYPLYLRAIRGMIAAGELNISSAVIAEKLGLDAVLTRKDLAMVGVPGRPRLGYPAKELEEAINRALGWDDDSDAILVGVGSLGNALLGYPGFEEQNLRIVAAFDSNPKKVGTSAHGVKIRHMDDLAQMVKQFNIKIGILTVPTPAAQECSTLMVKAGIKGIWNFAPIQLEVPNDVIVQSVDLAQSLAVLSHSIAHGTNGTGNQQTIK